MKFRIIWSAFAQQQLDGIYEYYKEAASPQLARKLLRGIINAPNQLIGNPKLGQIEEHLHTRKIEYRYLVHKNYKLIYSVDNESRFIKIADVFDTRQNPTKMEIEK